MKRGIPGALVVLLSAISLAPSAPIMLALEPDSSHGLGVGDIVDVGLYARSESPPQNVKTLQAVITYDHSVFCLVDANGDPASISSAIIPADIDPGLDWVLLNVVGPDADRELLDGEIYYSATTTSDAPQTDFLVATARFEVRTEFPLSTIYLLPDILSNPYRPKDEPPEHHGYVSKVIVEVFDGQKWVSEVAALELQGATLYGSQEPIPEPATLFLFCVGTCVLGLRRRSRRRHTGE